jgi:hypothetical protein
MPDWSGVAIRALIDSMWETNMVHFRNNVAAFDRIIIAASELAKSGSGKKRGSQHKVSRDARNEAVSLFRQPITSEEWEGGEQDSRDHTMVCKT